MVRNYFPVILTKVRIQRYARCRLRLWILTFVRMTTDNHYELWRRSDLTTRKFPARKMRCNVVSFR